MAQQRIGASDRWRKHTRLAIGLCASALASGNAAAQEHELSGAAEDAPVAGDARPADEEIIVTARRREERLLDIPVAANVLNEEAITKYGATDIQNIVSRLPQVNINPAVSGTGATVAIRGIGSTPSDASIEQAVAFNIDGVAISRGRVVQQAFFDLGDIQVLKGPQALFFGKNSPAGVISINSNSPSAGAAASGYLRFSYWSASRNRIGEGAISLPLSDTLSIRLAGQVSDMARGYVKGVGTGITDPAGLPGYLAFTNEALPGAARRYYPEQQSEIVRGTLKWEASDRVDVLLKVLRSNYRDNGDSTNVVVSHCNPAIGKPAVIDLGTAFAGRTNPILVDQAGSCDPSDRVSSVGALPPSVAANMIGAKDGRFYGTTRTWLASATLNFRPAEWLDLTAISGFYRYRHGSLSPYDYTIFSITPVHVDETYRSYSQELRVATKFDGAVNVAIGAFFQDDDRQFNTQLRLAYLPPEPGQTTSDQFGTAQYFSGKTYSVYAELNLKILRNVELNGGARYTHERKTADVGHYYVYPGLANSALAEGARLQDANSQNNLSPQLTLSWHPAPDVLLYGAFKTGYKSGGFSSVGLIPRTATVENQSFEAERVVGGELGLKWANILPGFSGDITLYNYKYQNLQVPAFDATTTAFFTLNAASARVQGAEVNLRYRPTRSLTLRTSVGYNKGRFLSFPNGQCWGGQPASTDSVTPSNPAAPFLDVAESFCVNGVQDVSGNALPKSPDWTLIYGLDWDKKLPGKGNWSVNLSAEARTVSSLFTASNFSPFTRQGGYTLLNISARLYTPDFELAAIVQNLTDRFYIIDSGEAVLGPAGQTFSSLGTPREARLQATWRF